MTVDFERTPRADAFRDLDAEVVRQVLDRKGWRGLTVENNNLSLTLGQGFCVVVISGKEGERNLAKLSGAHGDLPSTPTFNDASGTGEPRVVRVYALPQGASIPNAPNLHGAVAGVSVITIGAELLPPSVKASTLLRWRPAGHPSTRAPAELPSWLVDLARDPAAAHRAWGVARPSKTALRVLAEWERELTMHRGRPMATFANACTILRHAPAYAGRIVFDELVQGPTFEGKAITDGLLGRMREQCERELGVAFGGEMLRAAVITVAEERRVHPVQKYLAGLRWDGTARVDAVASTVLGATGELAAVMIRRFFVGAVARAMKPGCKLDTALVLVGPQGVRKSTFFQVLGGPWFTDTHVDLGNKDVYMQLAAAWIVEWGEIERVTGRRGADEIKSFLSSRIDRFRLPYGRSIVEVPRSCLLVGSTNQSTFLDDDTGSRRFWCVRVASVDVETLTAWRDQLWAEALALFESGEPWWLEHDDEQARAEDAEQHAVEDPWTQPVLRFLAREAVREEFTAAEVLAGALDVQRRDQGRQETARVGRILRAQGWDRRKHRPLREGVRGDPVWCWFRPEDPNAPRLLEDDDAPPP